MTIREDITGVLLRLATYPQYKGVQSQELADALNMSPERLNIAVSVLENSGYVKVLRAMGTAPFDFFQVEITPRGRLELERAQADAEAKQRKAQADAEAGKRKLEANVKAARRKVQDIAKLKQHKAPEPASTPSVRPSWMPVGSPYGFDSQDWEYISRQEQSSVLSIVFGYKWKSDYYDADKLISALTDQFTKALDVAKTFPILEAAAPLSLEFTLLKAGYGEHVFNKIARSIIAADIGVFETSDLNPNVMIEMGVALTWGVRVLPIREASTPPTPSDISGHTWACYRDSGSSWDDPDHFGSVVAMVDVAARKKLSLLP